MNTVERWLCGDGPEPSARDLSAYVLLRAERDYPGNAHAVPPIASGVPPAHDWLRRVALRLAKLTVRP